MTSYRHFQIIAESYRTLYEDFRIQGWIGTDRRFPRPFKMWGSTAEFGKNSVITSTECCIKVPMQWNFHVEENNINLKFETTYFDCESIRTNNWKEVCLFNIWKRDFAKQIETWHHLYSTTNDIIKVVNMNFYCYWKDCSKHYLEN